MRQASRYFAPSKADWQFAALKVKWKYFRLALALKAYDPSQPRVPAGNPDGGQWTSTGASNIGPTRIEDFYDRTPSPEAGRGQEYDVAVIDGPQQYSVVLTEEEISGGHTIAKHVKRPATELLDRLQKIRPKIIETPLGYEVRAAEAIGSFVDIGQANDFTNEVIRANKAMVDLVATGKLGPGETAIEKRFGYPTGYEAFRIIGITESYHVRKTYRVRVVIKYNPNRARSYTVVSSFPTNGILAERIRISEPEDEK